MMFRKTNIIATILTLVFATATSVAIVAVMIAMGLITPDLPAPQLNFVRNVGYSVFAGGIIILMVELPRIIHDLIREGGA